MTDQSEVWIGMLHVTPAPGNSALGDCCGAYVIAAARAANGDAFRQRVTEAMDGAGFKIAGFEDEEPFSQRKATATPTPEVRVLGYEAERSGEVEWGDFYTYDADEPSPLDALEEAISDVGSWAGWKADLPDLLELTFKDVEIWEAPPDGAPPPNRATILLEQPLRLAFLTRKDAPGDLDPAWADKLGNGIGASFGLDPLWFHVIRTPAIYSGQAHQLAMLLDEARIIESRIGPAPTAEELSALPLVIAFWAGPVGLIAAAERFRIRGSETDLELKEIPGRYDRWWQYWMEYWKQKRDGVPLPMDEVCEAAVPSEE